MVQITRRHLVAGMAAVPLVMGLGIRPLLAANKTLRVGFQKYGSLTLMKEKGTLENRLEPEGWTVTWTEFPGGPQMLEAMNVGAIDLATTGEAPPIFAQAAGAPLLYIGYEPPAPMGEAILVPKDSPIATVADLKGKKLALNKGSNVHYLVVQALAAAGVAYKDVDVVFLPPSDARAAFESGSVDAWAIWDPFYAAGQAATEARTLADGTGIVSNHQFFLATRDLAAKEPQVIDAFMEEIVAIDDWAKTSGDEISVLLSPRMGIPVPVLKTALDRMSYGVKPLTPEVVAEQQKIADTFHELGLLPKPISVQDAVWKAGA